MFMDLSCVRMFAGRLLSVTMTSILSTGAMKAKLRLLTLLESKTATTLLAIESITWLMFASSMFGVESPALDVETVHPEKEFVAVENLEVRLGDGPDGRQRRFAQVAAQQDDVETFVFEQFGGDVEGVGDDRQPWNRPRLRAISSVVVPESSMMVLPSS